MITIIITIIRYVIAIIVIMIVIMIRYFITIIATTYHIIVIMIVIRLMLCPSRRNAFFSLTPCVQSVWVKLRPGKTKMQVMNLLISEMIIVVVFLPVLYVSQFRPSCRKADASFLPLSVSNIRREAACSNTSIGQ